MDALDQVEGMLDHLLAYRGGDAGEHQKGGLDGVVRSDDVDGSGPVQVRGQDGREQVALEVAVVFGYEGVVGLGLDVFEGGKEGGVAGGVFEEGEAPAGEDTAGADLRQFEAAVLPDCGVFAA